ncbi:hypothetical protein FQN60_008807 [Etheostoma spectabile]|uniref:Uncharacterized protein n=1 Tax=Etheostoma spectabile TaxID=54343 RepID=A0A5J5CK37_9PERO|nr:hypothetical protein FQN60_008807 [Etheostoma spectabile]
MTTPVRPTPALQWTSTGRLVFFGSLMLFVCLLTDWISSSGNQLHSGVIIRQDVLEAVFVSAFWQLGDGSSLTSSYIGCLDTDRPFRWATFRGPIFFTSDLAPFFMPWCDNRVETKKRLTGGGKPSTVFFPAGTSDTGLFLKSFLVFCLAWPLRSPSETEGIILGCRKSDSKYKGSLSWIRGAGGGVAVSAAEEDTVRSLTRIPSRLCANPATSIEFRF